MKGLNFASASAWARSRPCAKTTSWTCGRCVQRATRKSWVQNAAYSTGKRGGNGYGYGYGNGNGYQQNGRGNKVIMASAVGGVAATGLAFTDDIRHAYEAVERTGRVVSTLFVCINE